MNYQVVIPVLISFVISVILGPIIIPFLRKLKMGQTERVEGVQSHLKKAGTPTMGGIIFSDSYCCNIPVLRKRLPEGDPGSVSDTGIWYHRISG